MAPRRPSPRPPAAPDLQPLPKGPHGLSRREVAESQRGRLLAAVATVVAERGYPSTTIRQIASTGRVSYATFYEHFRDKEDCFFAAYDEVVEGLISNVHDAVSGAPTALAALRLGLERYLEWFAGNPAAAVTYLLEIRTAGPRALERRAAALRRFEDVFWDHLEEVRTRGDTLPELRRPAVGALVAAIDALAAEEVRLGRAAKLPALLPTTFYVALVLLVGHEAASSFSEIPAGKPPQRRRSSK